MYKEIKTLSTNRRKLDYPEIYETIKEASGEGVLQSDLWKLIDASSREGSKVALRLMRAGLIRREKKLQTGKWTFVLVSNKFPVQVNSIMDCPCVFCVSREKCGSVKNVTPNVCTDLTQYLQAS